MKRRELITRLGGERAASIVRAQRAILYLIKSLHLAVAWVSYCSVEGALMAPEIATRVAIICVVSMFLCVRAAQEGYYGVGHDRWHMEFCSNLNRNDGKGSCCNLSSSVHDPNPTRQAEADIT